MTSLQDFLLPLITAVILSYLLLKCLKPLAELSGLVDMPNGRKKHSGTIPLIGGISVYLSASVVMLIWFNTNIELLIYLACSFFMVAVGTLDDKYDLSVRIRVIAQLAIAAVMIFGTGSYIYDLGDILAIGNVNLGVLGIPFTFFAVLVAINAFNMIDGIDGLLGLLSMNFFASVFLLLILSSNLELIAYPLVLFFSLIPYMFFNLSTNQRSERKVFMGDAGSMFIGFSIIWMLVTGTQGESSTFRPITALWIIALPLMDMLAIVIRRVKKKQSPFKPDREHLHHICMRIGLSDRQALLVIGFISILLSSIGIYGELLGVSEALMFFMFLAVFLMYNATLTHIWKFSKFIRSFQN